MRERNKANRGVVRDERAKLHELPATVMGHPGTTFPQYRIGASYITTVWRRPYESFMPFLAKAYTHAEERLRLCIHHVRAPDSSSWWSE